MTATINFFSLPAEIRNQIYNLVWPCSDNTFPTLAPGPSSLAEALMLVERQDRRTMKERANGPSYLEPLHVCRQIRAEAEQLAFGRATFHITGKSALPDDFHCRIDLLSTILIKSIKTLTLTARVIQLRALNESWEGLPFGHPCLHLERLIIIPQKPDVSGSCYAEIADLNQCHTLAYVLGETLKGLRQVSCVEVRNHGCFNDLVWQMVYRNLVYRLGRWGGIRCGLKLHSSAMMATIPGEEWFKVMLGDEFDGFEVGEEMCRLGIDRDLIS